jgi:SAM-dependent methyltransferase
MKAILDAIYKQSAYKSQYLLSENDKKKFKETGSHATYGEITQEATDSILELFPDKFNEKAVFYDLGCGVGKMVCHIGLKTGAKSVGIELSEKRLQGALDTKARFCKELNNIVFLKGDFLKLDIREATVVYCDNTVMPNEITLGIYDKLQTGCVFIYRKSISNEIDGQVSLNGPDWVTTYGTTRIRYVIKK